MWLLYKISVPEMYNYQSVFRTMKCFLVVKAAIWKTLTFFYRDKLMKKESRLMTNVWKEKKKNGLAATFYIFP